MALKKTLLQVQPIVAALARHKVATLLIVLQVALTLAVTSNAMFIVASSIIHLSRPSGTDEAHVFAIRSGWKVGSTDAERDTAIRADLIALRNLPGVRDAFSSQTYPMSGFGSRSTSVKLTPDQAGRPPLAAAYHADEHALDTLGVSLIAGRNFRADEIGAYGPGDGKLVSPGIIVSRSLGETLFPDGAALGKTVYLNGGPSTIIGIVDTLQSTFTITRTMDFNTILIGARSLDPEGVVYLVRTRGDDMGPVMAAAVKALQARGGIHLIDPAHAAVPLAEAREAAYATDRSMAALMAIICGLLLLATAGGIVGLSSFWVAQRRKQIGIRRSLGATTADILGYFHAENFVIVTTGIALGAVLAVVGNIVLMDNFPLQHMPLYVPALGALVLWLVGQAAVWGPARSAARVPPVVAIRTT